jgi:TRAP-type C4-dicarboxylate transport system permease small subunit
MNLAAGTAWHELVGHGLTCVALGGRITYVEILGVELWPSLTCSGWPDAYGHCGVDGLPTPRCEQVVNLAGSVSTWLVSVIAITALWARRWRRLARLIFVCLGTWWIDLLTYTLPSWGFRRSILWGPVYSEPYQAATGLGIPGWIFQAVVVACSALLASALILRLLRDRQRALRSGGQGREALLKCSEPVN